MTPDRFAISLRQPWAALVAAGLKTVEVRAWPTRRRGPVLIHSSKSTDDRPEAWAHIVTPELRTLADLRGGLLASVELTDCLAYPTAESFAADAGRHYNAPSWFRPGLFGFVLERAKLVPFVRLPGNTNFFPVVVPRIVVAPPERPAAGKDAPDE